MEDYKKEFIEFMLESGALKFGDFTLKSGRKSPFFMNAGVYKDGYQLNSLASFYAQAIYENFADNFDVLFGPSYKGIPLCVATSMKLYEKYNIKVSYSTNRKEIKDHGDGGLLLGDGLEGKKRVLIIEDVITSGKSVKEVYPIITRNKDIDLVGMIVSLDRMEYSDDKSKTSLDKVSEDYHMKASAIVNMKELVEYLRENRKDILKDDLYEKIKDYYLEYGVRK